MEESETTKKIEIPAEGWCWRREDGDVKCERRYWRNGKCIVVMVAQSRALGDTVVAITWGSKRAELDVASTARCVSTMAEALAIFEATAIGIHATLEALGLECRCLNVPG